VEELSRKNFLEELQSDSENSLDYMSRQVAFCARWSLDNLCKLFCCLCPVNLHFLYKSKKYVLSNSESVYCNFFIFDHVMFIQFKICCCVQNFMKIRWLFTEIWRYINFQNGGHPPSWNCFTTIWDHPWSLCCWPQLPVKFHVNLIHRSEDIAIWIFRIFGLRCLFRPPKWGFWGSLDP